MILNKVHILSFGAYFFIDEDEFRSFILWLEDQKIICHYKIEDRAGLRNIKSSDWTKAYESVRSSFTFMLYTSVSQQIRTYYLHCLFHFVLKNSVL